MYSVNNNNNNNKQRGYLSLLIAQSFCLHNHIHRLLASPVSSTFAQFALPARYMKVEKRYSETCAAGEKKLRPIVCKPV